MGKKFISVQSRLITHRLYEADIKKIYYHKKKKIPAIPLFI